MTDSFTVIPPTGEDLPPNRAASTVPPPPRMATCEVCGDTWEVTGKGPTPKRCAEHKTTRTNGKTLTNEATLKESVGDLYRAVALVVMPFDATDAMTINANADKLAESWIDLAKTDPKVAKFLKKMTQTSGWGGLLVAHAMVAVPILQHHGMIPGGIPKGSQS